MGFCTLSLWSPTELQVVLGRRSSSRSLEASPPKRALLHHPWRYRLFSTCPPRKKPLRYMGMDLLHAAYLVHDINQNTNILDMVPCWFKCDEEMGCVALQLPHGGWGDWCEPGATEYCFTSLDGFVELVWEIYICCEDSESCQPDKLGRNCRTAVNETAIAAGLRP